MARRCKTCLAEGVDGIALADSDYCKFHLAAPAATPVDPGLFDECGIRKEQYKAKPSKEEEKVKAEERKMNQQKEARRQIVKGARGIPQSPLADIVDSELDGKGASSVDGEQSSKGPKVHIMSTPEQVRRGKLGEELLEADGGDGAGAAGSSEVCS